MEPDVFLIELCITAVTCTIQSISFSDNAQSDTQNLVAKVPRSIPYSMMGPKQMAVKDFSLKVK
jgi:hypothetical protein